MSPKTKNIPISSFKIIPPPNRSTVQTGILWLKDKHETDGAEGIWRVHDKLYDLSAFVNSHPGGSEWLELTKGTDITEAFEVHHLTTLPEEVLKKYFIREASTKRNSAFTFKNDGFYITLKKEVMKVLKKLPKQPVKTSALITDLLLVGTFFFSILAAKYWNYWLAVLSGYFIGGLAIAAHNYFHQKDNIRMLYFNLSLMQTREWRISHVLSHHLHTNTINDMEITMNEPLMQFLPREKTLFVKYGYYLLFPLYWSIVFHASFLKRLIHIAKGNLDLIQWYDWIPYTLPLVMYVFGGQSVSATLWMWTFILLCGSFYSAAIGYNVGHHHPDTFHDGDTPRSDTDCDWGLIQLDAVMDRMDVTRSHFLVLTNFGDHALHHLFPSLDHGILKMLHPTLKKVCKEFNVDLRVTSQWELVKGSFLQIAKTKPNSHPPDLLKKY